MADAADGVAWPLTWAVATLPLAGQAESGDRHLVQPFPGGVLVAVVDALGHGPEAAGVAGRAITILTAAAGEPVLPAMRRCHEGLKGDRGVVVSLASFSARDATMTWLGVGNVGGVVARHISGNGDTVEHLLPHGGVVGYQLPTLRPATLPIKDGDTLIFATDGIRGHFHDGLTFSDPPQRLADRILAEHGKRTDDALVLVARYRGGGT